MRPSPASLPCLLLLLLLLLCACGGGGGAGAPGPVSSDLHLQLDGVTIDAGQADGTITLILDPLPPGLHPALLQADLVFDGTRLRPSTARTPLLALQGEPTLDGGMLDGAYKVICGDGRNPAATSLQAGPLFSLALEPVPPRTPGIATVELRNLRVVDGPSNAVPVGNEAVTARVTIR